MMRALYTAASGMSSQQSNVDTISNNLANINTAGYKSEKAEFKSLLYQNLQSRSTNSDGTKKPVSAQVGLGTRLASVTSQFTQGALTDTGETMDWGIEGDGFYKVDTGSTGIMYTRNASFKLSVQGEGSVMVTTSAGYPVLDVDNNPIIMQTKDGDETIYSTSTLELTQDGYLYMTNAKTGEKDYMGYQVGLVQFANPAGLEKNGDSLFAETENSGQAMEETENPGLERSVFRQNYLEASNVNTADEMVNLIIAQRAYEMNSKAIQAADEMMQQANNLR